MWCIPEASVAYVACMEDVLYQYDQPYDPKRPLVCFDEGLKQVIEETCLRCSAKPGQIERYDYEYKRHGVRNLNMFFEPLAGRRAVKITERHIMKDFAHYMRWLVDELYPQAEVIQLVMDNLNTHKPAALYETLPPDEVLRILNKLEFHYTPKHGSWLNMAEIELSAYSRCLPKFIPNDELLDVHVSALTKERNHQCKSVNWQFRTKDARVKLKKIYPSLSM